MPGAGPHSPLKMSASCFGSNWSYLAGPRIPPTKRSGIPKLQDSVRRAIHADTAPGCDRPQSDPTLAGEPRHSRGLAETCRCDWSVLGAFGSGDTGIRREGPGQVA